jgi:hypothetical protein
VLAKVSVLSDDKVYTSIEEYPNEEDAGDEEEKKQDDLFEGEVDEDE